MGKPLLLVIAGLLGASVVVLPAVASSEPSIEAAAYLGKNYWSPSTAIVNAGGSVAFKSPNKEINHGVEWRPGNPSIPTCEKVPGASMGEPSFKSGWSGACTFSKAGTYTFWCTYHGSEMSGTITVNATGTTTGATTTGTTTGSTTGSGGSTGGGGQGGATPPGASGSPLAGTAASAVKVPSSQHGKTVQGSVDVSQTGAGGRLEVDLLAKSASLANAGRGKQVRVGRLVRSGLNAGKVTFSVALNSRAKGALRRHGRLRLTTMLLISATTGGSATIARTVLMRP